MGKLHRNIAFTADIPHTHMDENYAVRVKVWARDNWKHDWSWEGVTIRQV